MNTLFNYVSSPSELLAEFFYALPYEADQLGVQIIKIRGQRQELSTHIAASMAQSSETWHDNAPADALFQELYQLDNRESKLVVASRFLLRVPYPTPEVTFATIGSRLVCEMHGDEFKLDIVGNLPIYESDTEEEGVERGSISAPMPRALLGTVSDQTATVDMGDRLLEIRVLDIDQVAQQTAHSQNI